MPSGMQGCGCMEGRGKQCFQRQQSGLLIAKWYWSLQRGDEELWVLNKSSRLIESQQERMCMACWGRRLVAHSYNCRTQRHACFSKVSALAGKSIRPAPWNKNVCMKTLEDSSWAEDSKALKLVDGVLSSRGGED